MAYQSNIPKATDALSQSQIDIQNNFGAISSLIGIDHANFADPNQGQHNKVTFPVQLGAPVFAAGSIGLYNLNSSLTSNNELFLTNSAGSSIPITASQQVAGSAGWAYLPSGVLFKWGKGSATGLTTITFPAGATIPAFNNIFSILVTTAYNNVTDSPDGFVRLNNFVAPWTQFTVFASHRTTTGAFGPVLFQYLAIGN